MQTFREYFDERFCLSKHMRVDEYHSCIGDAFIAYVDEVLCPAMEKANHPEYVIRGTDILVGGVTF